MSEKRYLSAQQLLEDSFRLGANIIKDGFRPSMMIAIWRGGVPMGIAIQELLAWYGIETDHITIRTSSYAGIDGRSAEIRVHGLDYLVDNSQEVSARTIHLIDECQTRHFILIRLTPDGLRLRLDSADSTKNRNRAI